MENKKIRVDQALVHQGLVKSRKRAQALIMARKVFCDSVRLDKPGTLVDAETPLRLRESDHPWVSRGGIKLAHALDSFTLTVDGLAALDVGASTGGFTDCLLQRGAAKVYAVDVGHGQLDYRLRTDSRVEVMEKVNARYPIDIPTLVDLATIDVSFISLTLVIPNVVKRLKSGCHMVALVKPQFEAQKGEVSRGGVIKDPMVHAKVLGKMVNWVVRQKLRLCDICTSPVLGDAGNREFFMLIKKQR